MYWTGFIVLLYTVIEFGVMNVDDRVSDERGRRVIMSGSVVFV